MSDMHWEEYENWQSGDTEEMGNHETVPLEELSPHLVMLFLHFKS